MNTKRLTKIGIGCTVAMLIPTILLGWWAINWARGVAKWSEAADDFPSVAEIRGPAIPDDENAAPAYERAWEALDLTEEQKDALYESHDPEVLAPILDAGAESLHLLHEAAEMEECRFEPVADEGGLRKLPYLAPMRTLARLAGAETRVHQSRNHAGEAIAGVEVRLRLARHLMQAPYGVMQLLTARSVVFRARLSLESLLGQMTPGADATAPLREVISGLKPRAALRGAYRVDVAESLEFMDALIEGDVPTSDPEMRQTYERAAGAWPYRWMLILNRAKFIEISRRRLERLEKPWRETAHLEPIPIPDNAVYIWVWQLSPHFGTVASGRDQTLANQAMVLVALDIEAFIAEKNRPPESLDELIDVREISGDDYALDPFSGERLRYEVGESGGYTLWSLGRDLDDDGAFSCREARDDPDRDSDDCDLVFRVDPTP